MDIIEYAIEEDLGSGDATGELIIPVGLESEAVIITREPGIICGLDVAEGIFSKYDLIFDKISNDGDNVDKNQVVAKLKGKTRAILSCERLALNFIQRMSGIATLTNKFVELAKPAKIFDTRKTTPGLRKFEKYAVKCGGGFNHRMGLYDMILIKDNHIKAAGGVKEAISKVKDSKLKIEVEVDTLEQLKEALKEDIDFILLDNFSIQDMKKAVSLAKEKVLLEASGGVSLDNVKDIASTSVDRVSVGMLTHSYKSLDVGLEIIRNI